MKARIKRRGVGVKKTEATAAGAATKKEAKPQVLKVKAGMKYRGAREAWYARLQEFDGKPVEAFLESAKEKPPSLTKKNEAENPTGWLRFFQRVGAAGIVNQA